MRLLVFCLCLAAGVVSWQLIDSKVREVEAALREPVTVDAPKAEVPRVVTCEGEGAGVSFSDGHRFIQSCYSVGELYRPEGRHLMMKCRHRVCVNGIAGWGPEFITP